MNIKTPVTAIPSFGDDSSKDAELQTSTSVVVAGSDYKDYIRESNFFTRNGLNLKIFQRRQS